MTEKLDLAELDRLLAAATPGEWMQGATSVKREALLHLGEPMSFHVRSVQLPQVDVALIVALRNAAPALLSELRALRDALRRREMCDSCIDTNHIVLARGCCPCDCGDGWGALDAALKEAGL